MGEFMMMAVEDVVIVLSNTLMHIYCLSCNIMLFQIKEKKISENFLTLSSSTLKLSRNNFFCIGERPPVFMINKVVCGFLYENDFY